MKELELAYVGNKRNLFCIEKQFVIPEKPPTPRIEDDEDEVEAQIMSYYIDTLGRRPEDVDTRNVEEDSLLKASAMDEDLRAIPMMPKLEENNNNASVISSVSVHNLHSFSKCLFIACSF